MPPNDSNSSRLYERIRTLAALATTADASALARATVAGLSAALWPDEADRLGRALPASLRAILRGTRTPAIAHAGDLFARVAAQEDCPLGASSSREHVQAACAAIAEIVDAEALAIARRRLANDLAELLTPPHEESRPDRPTHVHGRTTLAEGRPGSLHPISLARPERGHEHSVARNAEPHAETKLSSSRGLTQERQNESLATGRPGPKRPLDES
jgi:uncharacterized protein (DUF2267 family)